MAKAKSKQKNSSSEETEFDSFSAQTVLRSYTEGQENIKLSRYQPIFEHGEKKKEKSD